MNSKEYRSWAHKELYTWIVNTQTMYNAAMRIMRNTRLSEEGKARTLKREFGNFHNGNVCVGKLASYRKLVNDLSEK